MSEYFFLKTRRALSEENIKSIIAEAGYDTSDYTYSPLTDNQGWEAKGDVVMSISKLEFAAKSLGIPVSISATATALQVNAAGLANTIYSVDFQNSTPDTWTLSVYQTLPSSPGLKSVSWKQTTVPKNGESGVQWDISYLVGIANYKQQGGKGVYKASQKLSTQLGSKWACRFLDNTQQLFEIGSTAAGQVVIENQSGDFANLGIGMDGDLALVQSDVYSGNSAQFEVTPTYWVALYKDVVQGEVISGNQIHGPIKTVFPSGVTQLTYEAYVDEKQFVFGLKGGTALVVPLEQVERRLRALAA
jgi:rhizosphere induced protein